MKDCLLLTTVHGTPILIGDAGLTIEPEPSASDRTPGSIVILPNNNREKPKIIVQQAFTDICRALSQAGHLIKVTADEPIVKQETVLTILKNVDSPETTEEIPESAWIGRSAPPTLSLLTDEQKLTDEQSDALAVAMRHTPVKKRSKK